MKLGSLVLALTFLGLTGAAHARLWTSNDGKTLEAEWVSATQDQVTLRRPIKMSVPL